MNRNILITNDDGIESDGLIRLCRAAKEFGKVWVAAPAKQRSAVSHSITLRHSIEIHPFDLPVDGIIAYSCSGTPADCVRVGVCSIMPVKPDVVLSGINYGYNMASDIQYSATAGGAFEAEFQEITAIAVSEAAEDRHETADRYLYEVLKEVIDEPYVPGEIININFPGCSLDECKGILRNRRVSRQAYYKDHYNVLKEFEDGGIELMVEGVHKPAIEEGTDYAAILSNYVSIGRVRNIG
ncbi:MAG: 5'/3'-nucleotidase SurE [Lachnospiraceae bacterium]|nr:5'/3'-nucleotidase SurE [Lachnospiraceae bacterium]